MSVLLSSKYVFLKYKETFLKLKLCLAQLYGGLAQQVKERRKRGVDRGSLLDKVYEMVEDKGDPILDDEQVAYIGGVLLGTYPTYLTAFDI